MISIRSLMLALVGASALFAGGLISAATVSVGSLTKNLEVVTVGNLQSRPDETKEVFMRRAARFLEEFTAMTGFEGCGRIWVSADGGTWEVPLTSNEAHINCVTTNRVVHGFTMTGESIHSHPGPGQASYRVNAADRVFSGNRDKLHALKRSDGETFSKTDLKGNAGYLAAHGRLLYHSGGGAETVVDLGSTEDVAHGANFAGDVQVGNR